MSDQKTGVVVSPGKVTPSPEYRYQSYQGKSGSISTKQSPAPQKVFAELQNWVVDAG